MSCCTPHNFTVVLYDGVDSAFRLPYSLRESDASPRGRRYCAGCRIIPEPLHQVIRFAAVCRSLGRAADLAAGSLLLGHDLLDGEASVISAAGGKNCVT